MRVRGRGGGWQESENMCVSVCVSACAYDTYTHTHAYKHTHTHTTSGGKTRQKRLTRRPLAAVSAASRAKLSVKCLTTCGSSLDRDCTSKALTIARVLPTPARILKTSAPVNPSVKSPAELTFAKLHLPGPNAASCRGWAPDVEPCQSNAYCTCGGFHRRIHGR